MEWLIDKRSKSVASSAQRVVADMHRDLDLQKKKVTDLESLVGNLTALCTESLESEIFRLEMRRKELRLELERTDTAIQDRQARLEAARDDVRGILTAADQGKHVAEGGVSSNANTHNVHTVRSSSNASTTSSTASTPTSTTHSRAVQSQMSQNRAEAALGVPSSMGSGANADASGRRHRGTGGSVSSAGADSGASPVRNNNSTNLSNQPGGDNDNGNGNSSSSSNTRMVSTRSRTASAELRSVELEEAYIEETDMLAAVRDVVVDSPVLFLVHCSYVEDVIVYVPSKDSSLVLHCHKVSEFMDDEHGDGVNEAALEGVFTSELSNFDYLMTYGPKLVPNHERDYPHVREMVEPMTHGELSAQRGRGTSVDSAGGLGPLTSGTGTGSGSGSSGNVGTLIGAVQLPMIPDVIIDIWKSSSKSGRIWATTTIDGVSFAVVERIFMQSESRWGVSKVVQVDIFGRHPSKGYLVLENVTA